MAKKRIQVSLFRGPLGRLPAHKACVTGLGLIEIGQTVELEDTPSVRGMANKVHYMVRIEGE